MRFTVRQTTTTARPRRHRPIPALPALAVAAAWVFNGATAHADSSSMFVTFYATYDNSHNTEIALPVIHRQAGGSGTYDDPITFATDPGELPKGTRIWVPFLSKYFIMEDKCGQCAKDWSEGLRHVDLWMADSDDRAVLACEVQMTGDGYRVGRDVEVDPPSDHPVDTRPLYDPATGTCLADG